MKIEPTPQNEVILAQFIQANINKELKKEANFAEDLVDSTEVRRIVLR